MTKLVTTKEELAEARKNLPGTVGFVPTMGALHDGHVSNIRTASDLADHVVVSIFVNPLQFGPSEDFDSYPRPLAADLELCDSESVDLVFSPSTEEMYPQPIQTKVQAGPLGEALEGASRPGFFTGVLTVVAKLFHLVRPDFACFGEKDYQQLALVRRMAADLDIAVQVVGVATIRERDGLARSSRNTYLSRVEYAAALAIPRAITAAQQSRDPLDAARRALAESPHIRPDYVELAAPDLGPAPESGPARLLIAAFVGTTRLIDNAPVTIGNS